MLLSFFEEFYLYWSFFAHLAAHLDEDKVAQL